MKIGIVQQPGTVPRMGKKKTESYKIKAKSRINLLSTNTLRIHLRKGSAFPNSATLLFNNSILLINQNFNHACQII